jgi:predicted enzyme related to lactoylglutathione lyase
MMLFVQKLDTMKQFYTQVLQLPIVEEIPGQWVLLKAGHCHIGLHQVPPQYLQDWVPVNPEASNTKIVFSVTEDIFALRESLVAQQVVLRDIKTFEGYGYWLCDGQDPEGNVFQLKQQK